MITDSIYTENSIRTYTGKVFDLKILDPDSICIEDIAHALSFVPRFGGHLKQLYSVAQHSIEAVFLVPDEHKLAALLHDASEAYIGDMPSPFKKLMPDYKELENNLMIVIAEKFGFQYPLHPEVKKADNILLNTEWDRLVISLDFEERITPQVAETAFLELFELVTLTK